MDKYSSSVADRAVEWAIKPRKARSKLDEIENGGAGRRLKTAAALTPELRFIMTSLGAVEELESDHEKKELNG
jgi:hypothetical protein